MTISKMLCAAARWSAAAFLAAAAAACLLLFIFGYGAGRGPADQIIKYLPAPAIFFLVWLPMPELLRESLGTYAVPAVALLYNLLTVSVPLFLLGLGARWASRQ